MEEKTIVKIIQQTQHDLMNNLQVIQGYLSMDKIDVVKTKLADCIDYYHEERKLININAPHFILWIIQFNHSHDNIELSYRINTENVDLSCVDMELVERCKQIISIISHLGMKKELYSVHLQLTHESQSSVRAIMIIDGHFDQEKWMLNLQELEGTYVKKSKHGIICEHAYTI